MYRDKSCTFPYRSKTTIEFDLEVFEETTQTPLLIFRRNQNCTFFLLGQSCF
jgi:hypothetical protein